MLLVTHSGTFHADEAMAHAMLSRVFPGSQLVRTRDPAIIGEAAPGTHVVFDVGMAYDHGRRFYDHHMKDGPKREDGTPYSSVGLVWKHYGAACLDAIAGPLDPDERERVWKAVDRGLVRSIDMLDNGVGTATPSDFAAAIDDFNPAWDDPEADADTAFLEASRFAGKVLVRRVLKAAAAERAYSAVARAARKAADPRVVVLPRSMPWEKAIYDEGFGEALYVVYPRDGMWYCSAVPPERGSFSQRKPLPAEWGGLRDADLAAVSGVRDAVFCHPALFVCGAGSAEGIMAMATASANAPEPEAAVRP